MTAQERAEAYAVHHAARTWKDADDWKDVTLLLEEQLADMQRALERERRDIWRQDESSPHSDGRRRCQANPP